MQLEKTPFQSMRSPDLQFVLLLLLLLLLFFRGWEKGGGGKDLANLLNVAEIWFPWRKSYKIILQDKFGFKFLGSAVPQFWL
jgi:hypothetical protein